MLNCRRPGHLIAYAGIEHIVERYNFGHSKNSYSLLGPIHQQITEIDPIPLVSILCIISALARIMTMSSLYDLKTNWRFSWEP